MTWAWNCHALSEIIRENIHEAQHTIKRVERGDLTRLLAAVPRWRMGHFKERAIRATLKTSKGICAIQSHLGSIMLENVSVADLKKNLLQATERRFRPVEGQKAMQIHISEEMKLNLWKPGDWHLVHRKPGRFSCRYGRRK